MFQKKVNRYYQRIAAKGHCTALRVVYTFHHFFWVIGVTAVLVNNCTPPVVIVPPVSCPEPLWKEYSSMNSFQVKGETERLQNLLIRADTVTAQATTSSDSTAKGDISALEIKQRLFELAIHTANARYDFSKILELSSYLYQHGGPDSLRYLNWARVVREQEALAKGRDSIAAALASVDKEDKRESLVVSRLRKEREVFLHQLDSLKSVIIAQQEMIMKLQKLDVMMEQQRSKALLQ